MKKILSSFLVFAFLIFVIPPFKASAETPTSTLSQTEIIINLLRQIQQLQTQIETLKTQMVQLQQQKQETILQLLTTLKEGSKGQNVKTLQALLAADPEIYPEGLITGFYGRLTAEAVKRFQKRHGIEQVGIVGPKTLKKLNEWLEEHPLYLEDEDEDNDEDKDEGKKPCAIIPPGHLIAPGWLRKHDGVRPIVPICQILPPGIAEKLGWWFPTSTPTSTPDLTPPIISSVSSNVSTNSVVVNWLTNEPADSQVFYGTSTAYGLSTPLNSALVTIHSQTITGLTSNTVYHFQVKSKDAAGNLATSTDQTFITLVPDTTPPIISSIFSTVSSTSATISWTTNEPTTSKVYYSLTSPIDLNSASTKSEASLVLNHSLNLTGLNSSSTYYFVAESTDASNNTAFSSQQSFVTLGQ